MDIASVADDATDTTPRPLRRSTFIEPDQSDYEQYASRMTGDGNAFQGIVFALLLTVSAGAVIAAAVGVVHLIITHLN